MNPRSKSPIARPDMEGPREFNSATHFTEPIVGMPKLLKLGNNAVGVAITYGGCTITFGDENRVFSGRYIFDQSDLPVSFAFVKTSSHSSGQTYFCEDSAPSEEEKKRFIRDLANHSRSNPELCAFMSRFPE